MELAAGHRMILMVCGLLFCMWQGSASAQGTSVPIIDVHAHLIPDSDRSLDAALKEAVRMMDANGIATTILMSQPRPKRTNGSYDVADLRAIVKKYPGRFLVMGGGSTINPLIHATGDDGEISAGNRERITNEAKRVVELGAVGFGEIGGLHVSLFDRHPYTHVSADHPFLLSLADFAADANLPIDLHMDAVRSDMKPPPRLAALPNNPKIFPATIPALERLLAHNRAADIVWAHGGTDHLGEFSPATISGLMDRHTNLFVSLKIAGPNARSYNKTFQRGALEPRWRSLFLRHPDRFVIGTDSFYAGANAGGPGAQVARRTPNRLRATRAFLRLLPPGLAGKFGRENPIRIYNLTPEQVRAEIPGIEPGKVGAAKSNSGKGKCRDGNLEHCRIACQRGQQRACRRLKRQ